MIYFDNHANCDSSEIEVHLSKVKEFFDNGSINEAERALRHAVIARNIGFGTRTSEGSLAYSSLLSVIETCRLRDINPWTYIALSLGFG